MQMVWFGSTGRNYYHTLGTCRHQYTITNTIPVATVIVHLNDIREHILGQHENMLTPDHPTQDGGGPLPVVRIRSVFAAMGLSGFQVSTSLPSTKQQSRAYEWPSMKKSN